MPDAGLGYFAAAQFAVSFAVMQSGVAVMWLPNAVVLAALLRTRPRRWWFYCLPVIPAELLADIPVFSPVQAFGFAPANLIEVLITAGLLRRLAGGPFMLDDLRSLVEELRIDGPNGLQVQVTISIGVAQWGGPLLDFDALLKASDAAMYRAKAAGRNRVVYWDAGASVP